MQEGRNQKSETNSKAKYQMFKTRLFIFDSKIELYPLTLTLSPGGERGINIFMHGGAPKGHGCLTREQ
jgi:hypothetical protein